ncbi:hypothetical protein UY3_08913 [Chelonia mydas]|uniref:Uncharacterized protein n=1 Tax=Chelonia mydas TaxID=8469 RepID=M7C0P4_CHEMY|nr:hypothetical protein UY3_08913 [Chelonia mydas]
MQSLDDSANRGSHWPRFTAPGQWELREAVLAALPAGPIALERRTTASGSHDWPNLQTQQGRPIKGQLGKQQRGALLTRVESRPLLQFNALLE